METIAEKKFLFDNSIKQSSVRLTVEQAFITVQKVATTFNALGIGTFSMEDLWGDSTSDKPRAVIPEGRGCASCDGMKSYEDARIYIEDRLLEQMPAQLTLKEMPGLKLSKVAALNLLEFPDEELISKFNKALTAFNKFQSELMFDTDIRKGRYSPFDFLEVKDGKVSILTAEVDAYCETLVKYVEQSEDVAFMESLQTLFDQLTIVNSELSKRGLLPIKLESKPTEVLDPRKPVFTSHNDTFKLNAEYLAMHLK